ncbi:MAG: arginine--tRNA ligase [Candidatus Sungbacteria bacterium RIFCSPLOWO2_01_FULL_47_32]|uniref:Arginine--tRNA ligase n=1 Tax=Candidatus Sungbacteria bacterium RIFCSPHIGHO2_01_FULL_47_32 TaxID=1802264 RepID=A0A1G2K465_9BACT|nr:MAG: arginine--tRNA ligase [Candidatus Sungbacteria bacterium RIFCSPHIGHO2_01_FULL_47_32]OGZ99699.1 MAG: arginine--tRNA ligase [Candidatus Sungbacteria bacterium RIFCSPHIGHO2_02_FULL_46_12]OHA05870.1 MAG: arginine--tRNA ligase [Candidatus Sungbacteria bacterium RIFCSPLOWO2_01_FULL_47_32]
MIREDIRKIVRNAAEKKFGNIGEPVFTVEVPENSEHGDYSTNIAMALARTIKKNPLEIAALLTESLKAEKLFSSVAAAPPGFINFRLNEVNLLSEIQKKLKNKKAFGKTNVGKGKTVLVEYFQLNIAKRPHVGHLRSAVIGDALKRVLLLSGYKAVSDTHVGDWGTQFGILLLGFKEAGMSVKDKKVLADPFGVLEELYIKENEKIEADSDRREKAKLEFAKLEKGDRENRKIWKWMVDISMKNLETSAHHLGLLKFDEHKGESSYEKDMPGIVALAFTKRVAIKKDGAAIVDLSDEKLDEAVLVKSDGASTYLLRDLATIQYREKKKYFKNLYVVDVRQQHHFRQVHFVAASLGFNFEGESRLVEFGAMTLPEGKMSTRKGNIISLESLLKEAGERALKVIKEKNPELKNMGSVAGAVGLGAIKYFDLSRNRKSDIVFRWEDALAFEGNTGPYLQYTHARLKSILRKAKKTVKLPKNIPVLSDLEHEILSRILSFEEAIEDSLASYAPNILANYLHSLAQNVNEFYHSHPVLNEPDEGKKAVRLMLVESSTTALKQGLWCLGIVAPEEM